LTAGRTSVSANSLRRWWALKLETPVARQRPVDEEQVQVVEAEVGQRPVVGAQGVVAAVEAVVQLAGHEDLVAGDARARDGLADTLLVAVHLGGVDVPVADLEGDGGHCRSHECSSR
jgi:hypothetical protein